MTSTVEISNSEQKHQEKKPLIGRIAYILDSFPNISETFVSNEINELIILGYEVEIFSCHHPKSPMVHESAKYLLGKTIYLPRPVKKIELARSAFSLLIRSPLRTILTLCNARSLPGPHFKWTAKQSLYLAATVAKYNCNRIHVHFAAEAARYGMFTSKFLNLPFTLTVHSPMGENESDVDNLSVVGKHANAVITISSFNKSHISQKFGISTEKIHVNPNGIQNTIFNNDLKSQRVSGRLLTVARLHPDKGINFAVEAASLLLKQNVDFEWIIIGDGPERDCIEHQIKTLGLSKHVKLLGFQSTDRVVEELKVASLFVLSSISESQGVVYLEAMAMGTPIVGTDIYGVSETVIDGKTGFLVPTANPEKLAEKVLQLLNDETLRQKFSQASLQHVNELFLLSDRVKRMTEIWSSTKGPTNTLVLSA